MALLMRKRTGRDSNTTAMNSKATSKYPVSEITKDFIQILTGQSAPTHTSTSVYGIHAVISTIPLDIQFYLQCAVLYSDLLTLLYWFRKPMFGGVAPGAQNETTGTMREVRAQKAQYFRVLNGAFQCYRDILDSVTNDNTWVVEEWRYWKCKTLRRKVSDQLKFERQRYHDQDLLSTSSSTFQMQAQTLKDILATQLHKLLQEVKKSQNGCGLEELLRDIAKEITSVNSKFHLSKYIDFAKKTFIPGRGTIEEKTIALDILRLSTLEDIINCGGVGWILRMDPLDSFKSEVSVSLMFNLATDKVLRILFLEFKRYDNEAVYKRTISYNRKRALNIFDDHVSRDRSGQQCQNGAVIYNDLLGTLYQFRPSVCTEAFVTANIQQIKQAQDHLRTVLERAEKYWGGWDSGSERCINSWKDLRKQKRKISTD
ncbi:Protein of unknown function [Pyronema omphalodes CBS 100304]|uniref:Uncharacterized protein n=1 Tax=Pyronema omphalodes (strain CBS 100304) TaxID=1076935 RepID=U4L6L4_PYROM|nr:Protein of unknown function [Pyronema omphalodes CBS 100304]